MDGPGYKHGGHKIVSIKANFGLEIKHGRRCSPFIPPFPIPPPAQVTYPSVLYPPLWLFLPITFTPSQPHFHLPLSPSLFLPTFFQFRKSLVTVCTPHLGKQESNSRSNPCVKAISGAWVSSPWGFIIWYYFFFFTTSIWWFKAEANLSSLRDLILGVTRQ